MDTITWALRLLVLIGMLVQSGLGLKCYSCNADSNELCSREEDVIDCDESSTPTPYKYDTCQTILTKTPEEGVKIMKKCTVGPCTLDSNQNRALNLNCDRSGPKWNCEQCCKTDRCNISSAPALRGSTKARWSLLMGAAILAAMLVRRAGSQYLL